METAKVTTRGGAHKLLKTIVSIVLSLILVATPLFYEKEEYVAHAACSHSGYGYYADISPEPTARETGFISIKCNNCGGEVAIYVLPKITLAGTGYTTVDDPTQVATCRTQGSKMYYYVCDYGSFYVTSASVGYGDHVWGDWVTSGNVRTRTCSVCGKTETETISTHTHSYGEWTTTTAAGCTTTGVQTRYCSCGATETQTISALGHNYGSWVTTTAATCTAAGVQTKTCSRCNDKQTQSINALGHSWNTDYTIDTPATCTTAGSKSIHCSRCNAIQSGTSQTIAALGHNYGNWVTTTAATCTAAGVQTKTCSRCNAKQTQSINALGHSWNTDYTIDTPATCTTAGSKSIHCSRCNAIQSGSTQTINATNHSYGAWTVTKAATCAAAGSQTRTCSKCGKTENQTIAATGNHTYGSWVTTTAATCTAAGSQTRVCTVCGKKETQTINATGHTWNSTYTVDKAATCTAAGSQSIHCSKCNAIQSGSSQPISALGHNYNWVITAGGCTTGGSKVGTCSRCNATTTESIAATGHSWQTVTVAATCTANGSSYQQCTNCGAKQNETTITATGHSFGSWTTVTPATCTANGSEKRVCTKCNNTETRTVNATGHSYGDWIVISGSCTAGGTKQRICSACGNKETESVAATGHNWGSWVNSNGSSTMTCSNCGEAKKINRLAGSSRFDTSIKSADQLKASLGVDKFDNIIVASGEAFPDALAGSYLATVKNAPMLLTAKNNASVQATTANYIKNNLKSGGTVYILGGTGAVASSFEGLLSGINVKRLAGSDRYETNLLILNEASVASGSEILVCKGGDFADSLSASAVGKPILLVGGRVSARQISWLNAHGNNNKFYLIGGTGAVTTYVDEALAAYGTTERVYGNNRFETSVAIAKKFFSNPTRLVLAYSQTAWDGLSAGPLAAKLGAPLILTLNSDKWVPTASAYVKGNATGLKESFVLGGTALINETNAQKIFEGK